MTTRSVRMSFVSSSTAVVLRITLRPIILFSSKVPQSLGLLFPVQNDDEAWAVGGGGSLWYSTDGGKTFKFSSGATNIGANLYDVKFFGGDKGFAIGSDGVLLK